MNVVVAVAAAAAVLVKTNLAKITGQHH